MIDSAWLSKLNSPSCRAKIVLLVAVLLRVHAAGGQDRLADPAYLEQHAATAGFSLGRPTSVSLTPDGSSVLFLRSGPRTFVRDLYTFDVATGQERVLLTADSILKGQQEGLTAEELARRERMRSTARGIAGYQLSDDGAWLLVPLAGKLFVIESERGKVIALPDEGGFPIDPRFSPDAKQVAVVRSGDLYVIDVKRGIQHRLTTTASETLSNGTAEFVAQEEMGRFAGNWWSPDGKYLAYQETDETPVEQLRITDPAHPEREPNTFRYPRPGKDNARVRLGVISAEGGSTTWIAWDRERYPYLARVEWAKDAPLTILVQNREQTEEVLFSVDATDGRTTELLRESDPAWLNLDESTPRWLEDGSAFLWATERSGRWQLELRAREGALVRSLTARVPGFRGLIDVDPKRRVVLVSGGPDPTQNGIYEVDLDAADGEPTLLTPESGLHGLSYSKDFQVRIHSHNAPGMTSRQLVERADGTLVGTLKSVAERPPFEPQVEYTTIDVDPSGEASKQTMHALLIRPRDFQPSQSYPVIVSVYGGPGSQTVMRTHEKHLLQWMSDHGFIVVSLDGRGTPGRGRDWERAIKGNLISVPLDDQAAGLQALGAKYRELDLSRVGIYGWSFGGYFSAMAVMQRPDIYHVGVAGAPVVDWLDYDTHYTERYLGMPERSAEAYQVSSVLTYAEKLRRPLLFIHGTADDNVYFAHSVKAADALFRSGKAFDFLPLAGQTHMVAEPTMVRRRGDAVMQYFVRHLKQATPEPIAAGR